MSPEDENKEPEHKEQPASAEVTQGSAKSRAPQYENLKDEAVEGAESKKIDFLYDIELDVNIELGRAELKVRDVLSLQPGSVVELNRLAGDPVDIIINSKLIARGEVIVIDDNFAIRVTEILTSADIVNNLGTRSK